VTSVSNDCVLIVAATSAFPGAFLLDASNDAVVLAVRFAVHSSLDVPFQVSVHERKMNLCFDRDRVLNMQMFMA
jgi:hypothetical protein